MGEKPEVLEAVLKEAVDLVLNVNSVDIDAIPYVHDFLLFVFDDPLRFVLQENIPIEEVFENLRCSREGLTTQAAQERLAIFGHNKLEEKRVLFLTPLSPSLEFL